MRNLEENHRGIWLIFIEAVGFCDVIYLATGAF